MSDPSTSTAAILLRRWLQETCGLECVDWAASIVEQGKDGPDVLLLATTLPPFNHFEIAAKRDRALRELAIPDLDIATIAYGFAALLLRSCMSDEQELRSAFGELNRLYSATELPHLLDFYLLSYAYEDLTRDGYQYYWDNADLSNINELMKSRSLQFVAEHHVPPELE